MVTKTLEETKKLVFPEIQKYLKDPVYPKFFKVGSEFKKEIDEYWKINKEYPDRKGKYLRPTLVLLTAQALGNKFKKLTKLAAAMQLSEEWILIHDDIEDNSEVRRNKPTLHKMYGNELAINAGDVLHIIMWRMISNIGIQKITDEFSKILLRTTLGQGVEQIWTNKRVKINEKQYFFTADSKSGYYSITGPMRLGAIAAGASQKQIDKLTEFGLYLGRCFQLTDDILDFEQDKKEGKQTLANLKGIDYCRKLINIMKIKIVDIFDKDLKFLKNEPARSKIRELIDFVINREV